VRNRLGVYYAFLADSDRVDWRDCLARASAAGCRAVELSAPKLADESPAARASIVRLAADLDLSLSLATALPPDGDVSSPNGPNRRKGIDFLKRNVEMASRMGAARVCGMLYGVHKSFPPGAAECRDELLGRSAESLRDAAASAQSANVRLCVEAVNRFESPLVNTAGEAVRFAQRVGSPAVGVLLDTFHMNIEEDDLGAAIRAAGPWLAHVHICENNRKPPGRGHLPWISILAAMRAAEYRGDIVIEALPFPYGSVSGRLNIWRRLIELEPDAELRAAVAYVEGLLRE
jgi:D-psicose/D-tagatose/L-ribulose 3-epimerase